MQQEIELKLVLSAEAAEEMIGSAWPPGKPSRRKMHALYFDTPDHTLRRAGISLRIRQSGRKRVQTIKCAGKSASKTAAPPATGLFARMEWEKPVRGDLPLLDEPTPVTDLLDEAVASLATAFEVKVERSTWLLEEQDAQIEMVLDRGTAVAIDRWSPICEIELELKQGEPAAIFALARDIADKVPVRLGIVTKAERGYTLLEPAHQACKAEKVYLPEEASAASAFQTLAGLCLRHYRLNEDLLIAGAPPEALHQARVALRRLRSAIAIFKPMLAGERMDHLEEELRWLAGVLGEARDLDVMLETAGANASHHLSLARDEAYARVMAALDSPRARGLFLDLTEWITLGAWLHLPDRQTYRDQPAADFAASALHKLRKRLRKRGKGLAKLSDEERHALRKAAKRLRYGIEFFGSLFHGHKAARRFRTFAASLERLQDDLGALNDLVTMPVVLGSLGLLDASSEAKAAVHRKKRHLLAEAGEDYEGLIKEKAFWPS